MKIFAISDLHMDYEENKAWIHNLSFDEYKKDILIVAGDISDTLNVLEDCFIQLQKRFYKVMFVPGNHDLWLHRSVELDSISKFNKVIETADNTGILTTSFNIEDVSVIPLYGWYDYSFGKPSAALSARWTDFIACRWPDHLTDPQITDYFTSKNEGFIPQPDKKVITFSHFLPRLDLIPFFVPPQVLELLPVLGSTVLDTQLRKLGSFLHIYGHSHLNRDITIKNIRYLNNAFGYPYESYIAKKELVCVYNV